MEKYSKVRHIGKGNMGTCALARNNEDGKYYVVKQVNLSRLSKKDRQQSLNEARVLSSLRHPNIIDYVDSFLAQKSNNLCIVMEYADGGDLSSRLKKNHGVSFKEDQILDWFIQLVMSLHYVHQRKILHRDVKSQNIFLTSDNVVKLGDFGIAKTLCGTYDQAKTFVGTPYYLSPELLLEKPYDYRSDVWALGVVLYEMLTLKQPFSASDMKSLMQRILKVQYDPIPITYSVDLRAIVPQLLTREPSQRIELQKILELPIVQQRLQRWLDGDMVPAKYLERLLKRNLLPQSVLHKSKPPGFATEPPVSKLMGARGKNTYTLDLNLLPTVSMQEYLGEPAIVKPQANTNSSDQNTVEPLPLVSPSFHKTPISVSCKDTQLPEARSSPQRLGGSTSHSLNGAALPRLNAIQKAQQLYLKHSAFVLRDGNQNTKPLSDLDNFYQQLMQYPRSQPRLAQGGNYKRFYRPYQERGNLAKPVKNENSNRNVCHASPSNIPWQSTPSLLLLSPKLSLDPIPPLSSYTSNTKPVVTTSSSLPPTGAYPRRINDTCHNSPPPTTAARLNTLFSPCHVNEDHVQTPKDVVKRRPIPSLEHSPQLDIKALLQKVALDRAQRKLSEIS